MKRGVLVLFVFLFVIIMLAFGVIAPSHPDEPDPNDEVADDGFDDFDDEFEDREKFDDAGGDFDCAVALCQSRYTCVQGVGCLSEDDYGDELEREAREFTEELEVDAGLTPDSAFYFIDEFFDRFGSDLEVREEKIAEMRAVADACGGGDESACDSLRKSFEKYKEHADVFEREVTPEQREEAERSSKAIRGVLIREIAQNAPPTLKDELVREVIGKEKDIFNAAEIASKIKELCEALSELDPLEYSRVCRIGDDADAPDWHRALDRDLTAEQEKEAREFFKIMSQCIETSGRECRCGDIGIPAFADKCAIIAPLEAICDDESIPEVEAEAACDKVDELTENIENLLPDYLLDVLDQVIEDIGDEGFDSHGPPRECREAGAFDRESCMRVM